MRKIEQGRWTELAGALRREVAKFAPEWTDHDASDPGTTILELFAFLGENLLYSNPRLDERGVAAARRWMQAASVLAGASSSDVSCGVRRVNYFAGQLLGVAELTAEQSYFRERLRRRNRALHGAGVVSGLRVSIERDAGETHVRVEPGLAFDARGEEIAVCEPRTAALPERGTTLWLLLRYVELPCDPVVALGRDVLADEEPTTQPSRVAETFALSLAPTSDDAAIALARLRFARGRWQLDRQFKVKRVRR